MIDWVLAITTTSTVILCLFFAWGTGKLNRVNRRIWLVALQVVGLFALVVLKALQVRVESAPSSVFALVWGFCRRLSDPSWWSVLNVFGMTLLSLIATTPVTTPAGRGMQRWCWLTVGLSICVYLAAVYKSKETFFFVAPWSAAVKWIQFVEGTMLICWIAIGHFFLWELISVLRKLNHLPLGRQSFVKRTPVIMCAYIGGVIGVNNFLSSGYQNLCEGCPGWKNEPADLRNIVGVLVGLWWPVFILFVETIKAWINSTQPPEI